jgi:phosphatidylserine/phosphatidylglycerophosphate/cardiolipin synthase-like enzyme
MRIRQRLQRAGICVLSANLFYNRFEPHRRWLRRMNFHLDYEATLPERWVERQNQWQVLHNVEDHRKNLVIDAGRAGALTSHNLFDTAYDWHENLFWLTGSAARQLWGVAISALKRALEVPQPVSDVQRRALLELCELPSPKGTGFAPSGARVDGYEACLSDGAEPIIAAPMIYDEGLRLVQNTDIRGQLSNLIAEAGTGDTLLVASAYFSAVDVLDELWVATQRGAHVRVLIDSLQGLFLPKPLAWLIENLCNERVRARAVQLGSLDAERAKRFEIRVHSSEPGPVMHLKTAARVGHLPALLGGQANFTPNSFNGAWLETDVYSESPELVAQFAEHFDALWSSVQTRPMAPGARRRGLWREVVLRGFEHFGLTP